jgi:hypothetical protein
VVLVTCVPIKSIENKQFEDKQLSLPSSGLDETKKV